MLVVPSDGCSLPLPRLRYLYQSSSLSLIDDVMAHPSDGHTQGRYERKMGDSELAFYLPSRAEGVNDM